MIINARALAYIRNFLYLCSEFKTNHQKLMLMSVAQAIASSRFLSAMGPMIEDEKKMNRVLNYIVSLREDGAPCQFSTEEIIEFANKAEREYAEGLGMMSHSDFKHEVATWQR